MTNFPIDDEPPPRTPPPCPFEKIFPSELARDDAYYMRLAYNLGIDAWRHDEVPIGCVIVRSGVVLASAWNMTETSCDPTAHAEIIAITQAARAIGDWRLNGCTLYVTKEPCPMCSGAAIMARLDRVVYAVPDPKMGCLGGATATHDIPTLNHHLQITSGVLEDECRALLQTFFQFKREKRGQDRERN